MPRRTKEEANQTRESLLKAALTVFAENGYATTTLEDIAHAAGVTRGAVYWHFNSKAELFTALLDRYASLSAGIVQAAAAEGGDLLTILERVFVRLLAAVETIPDLQSAMQISLFKTERLPELEAVFTQRQQSDRALIESITEVMRSGISSGLLRGDLQPEEMARSFLAFQNGLIYLWLQDRAAFSLSESAPHFAQIFLNGIRASRA